MMKIALDLTSYLTEKNPRGIGRYSFSLFDAMKNQGVDVLTAIKLSRVNTNLLKKLTFLKDPLFYYKGFKVGHSFDLFHATEFNFPYLSSQKFVITLHDLYFLHPEAPKKWANKKQAMFFRIFEKLKPDAVITVSNFTRNQFLRIFPDYSERTYTVYPGVSTIFGLKDREKVERFLKKNGLKYKKYLLFVGIATDRRKNVSLILNASKHIRDFEFVFAGTDESEFKKVFGEPEKHKFHFFGFLEEKELALLYNGAFAFVFPSFIEGFGLPIIESMACGTPVITTPNSGTKEAAGDFAIFVNSDKPEELLQALERLRDPEFYAKLQKDGLNHARKFNWEETARRTIEIYKKTLDVPR